MGTPDIKSARWLEAFVAKACLQRGLVSPEQLADAWAERAGGESRPLGPILVARGALREDQFLELLEAGAGVSDRERAELLDPQPGLSFGKYVLLRHLGRGGMATVFEALDLELRRRVALKFLARHPNADASEAQQDEERFVREAQLTARLPKHPHIVSIYEVGVREGRRFLAMELVEGVPFSEGWGQGKPLRDQVAVLRDTALAVHHAHENGIVHRDLKPANILVDAKNQPHVTDFGLAKTVGHDVRMSLTAEGMVVGTPAYMSPEQAKGLKGLDRRTDVYSLGVILYEMLSGRQPFEGDTAIEILLKMLRDPVPPPSERLREGLHGEAPGELEKICLKALAKEVDGRYPDARALAEDLTRWLEGERVRAHSRRRTPWVAAGAAALAVAGAAAFFLRPGDGPGPERPPVAAAPLPPPARLEVDCILESPPRNRGIRNFSSTSDRHELLTWAGKPCAKLLPNESRDDRRLYFDVDDAWPWRRGPLEIEVEYFDSKHGKLQVEYDSRDESTSDGRHKVPGRLKLRGTEKWTTVRWSLPDPRLENRQRGGTGDFWIETDADLYVHRVALRKVQDPYDPLKAVAANAGALRPGAVGEYYLGKEFGFLALRRVDPGVQFEWGKERAWPGGPQDLFSARWGGTLEAPATGPYAFFLKSDEGARLFVDDAVVVSNWSPHEGKLDAGACLLEKGMHHVVLEYFEGVGPAGVSLTWKPGRELDPAGSVPVPFLHDPASIRPAELGLGRPRLVEAESLPVVRSTGGESRVLRYGSGNGHFWWGERVKEGDEIMLSFGAPDEGRATLVLVLSRSKDHGTFRVSVNGTPVAESLDLYAPEVQSYELECPNVKLLAGPNELSFKVVGTNPSAEEWRPGSGLHKIGLDYLLIR